MHPGSCRRLPAAPPPQPVKLNSLRSLQVRSCNARAAAAAASL